MKPAILIGNKQEETADQLKSILSYTFPLIVVTDGDQCLAALKQGSSIGLAFVGSDIDLSGQLFEKMRELSPRLTIIAIGEAGSEGGAVEAVSRGANGYIMLPLRNNDVMSLAQKYAFPA